MHEPSVGTDRYLRDSGAISFAFRREFSFWAEAYNPCFGGLRDLEVSEYSHDKIFLLTDLTDIDRLYKARFRRRYFHEPSLIQIKADPNYLEWLN